MNQIDKLFKNKLEHYHTEVTADKWEHIASRLPDQKKPSLKVKLGLTLLFTFAVGYAFWLSDIVSTPVGMTKISFVSPENSDSKGFIQAEPKLNTTTNPDNPSGTNKLINLISGGTKSSEKKEKFYAGVIRQDLSTMETKTSGLPAEDKYTPLNYEVILSKEMDEAVQVKKSEQIVPSFSFQTVMVPKLIRVPSVDKSVAKDTPAKACPFVSDYQNKSVDIYYSNDYGAKTLIPVSGEYLGYKTMREQTESAQYSFSAGVRFGYNLSYRWNLHTGFNYSQINEKFEYTDPESKQTRVITIKDYIYQNGKIVDSVINEKLVEVPGTAKLKIYNKYKSFDIPLIARYTLYANPHMSLSAQAGVYLNLATHQRGVIMDTDNITPVSINSDQTSDTETFKTQAGISMYGALSIALHLTSTIDILAEPNVRIQTESMTTGNYPLVQRFNTFGLGVGLRYKF